MTSQSPGEVVRKAPRRAATDAAPVRPVPAPPSAVPPSADPLPSGAKSAGLTMMPSGIPRAANAPKSRSSIATGVAASRSSRITNSGAAGVAASRPPQPGNGTQPEARLVAPISKSIRRRERGMVISGLVRLHIDRPDRSCHGSPGTATTLIKDKGRIAIRALDWPQADRTKGISCRKSAPGRAGLEHRNVVAVAGMVRSFRIRPVGAGRSCVWR